MNRAVFLDRDGVLNNAIVRDGLPYSPRTLEEFEISSGAVDFCRRLKNAGYLLIVVTNQPDVGRGKIKQHLVEHMHEILCSAISIDEVKVCYASGSEVPPDPNRKPKAGMLLDASVESVIDLKQSWMVGDRWRDVECGKTAGCKTIFIDYGYQEELLVEPDFTVISLDEACNVILKEQNTATP